MTKFLARIDLTSGAGESPISSGDQIGAWLIDTTLNGTLPTTLTNGDVLVDKYSKRIRCYSSKYKQWSYQSIYMPSDASKTTKIDKLDYTEVRSTITAALATGRDRMAAATLMSAVYMAGGNSSGGDVTTIDKLTYDNTRSAAASALSAAKCEMGADSTTFSGVSKMYMFGGSAGGRTNLIEKLDTSEGRVTTGATLSAAKNEIGDAASRAPASWTSYPGAIYVFGGNTGSLSNTIERLSSESTCATFGTTLTAAGSGLASISLYDKIYIASIGSVPWGSGGTNVINKLTGDASYSCAAIAATRTNTGFYPGAGETDNRGYVFGGAYGVTNIDRIANDSLVVSISATLSAAIVCSPGATR